MATKQTKPTFKVGQKVKFSSRARSGTGKIVAIRTMGLTGAWYDVRYDSDNIVSVRASQLSAA